MAQDWIMRYPLIDVHGNYGTVGGDGAAASRYTESRLTLLPEEGMLKNLNKEIVDTQPNYSEDLTEPCLLPAVFPNLLCNPTKGIGVAIATEFLPHNLVDISDVIINYIRTGNLDYSNLYPDFPLGGTIVNKDSVHKIYETGKGSVILEANYSEERKNGKRYLVFHTIPFQVTTENLLTKVNEVCEEGKVTGIVNVYDDSNDEKIRIVFELSQGADTDKVAEMLYAETDLRKTYSANQVAIVSKTPMLLNLQQIVDIYVNHNTLCIKREFEYDADKTEKRIHILEGLLIAVNNIDEVIYIIRNDKAPKETLKITFDLDEEQVKAILDMKLARLSKLEVEKLENELQEKKEYLEYCLSIIKNQVKQKAMLIDRLTQLVKKFGDERRTQVIQKEISKNIKTKEKMEVQPEDVILILNKDGYLKSVPIKSYKASKDIILDMFKTDTTQLINLYSNQGRMFRVKVSQIQNCGVNDKGTAVGSLLNLNNNEKILMASPQENSQYDYILFMTKNGIVKKTKVSEYSGTTQNVKGLKAINLKDKDEVVSIALGTDIQNVFLITNNGYCIRFSVDNISYQGKIASGVKGIVLRENDYVVKGILCNEDDPFAIVGRAGNCKLVDQSEFPIQGRGGKGAKVSGEPIAGVLQVKLSDEIRLITAKGSTLLKISSFKQMSRHDYGLIFCKQEVIDIIK